MKINQSAHYTLDSSESTFVINAAATDASYKNYIVDTGHGFTSISKLQWSIGSVGYIEFHWKGTQEGFSHFTLSGNGVLDLKANKPVDSDGTVVIKYFNFSQDDAAMVVITGSID